MSIEQFQHNILSQAIVGTSKPCLDLTLLPQNLQTVIQGIQNQHDEPEAAFYQTVMFTLSNSNANTELAVNSFSIEQIHELQNEQIKAIIAEKSASGKKSRKTKGSKAQSKQAQTAQKDDSTAESLIEKYNNHLGPKPLAIQNTFGLPEFPLEIEQLLLELIKECKFDSSYKETNPNIYLFWLLYRLKPFNMQFSSRVTDQLLEVYHHLPAGKISLGENRPVLTDYLFKELLIRMGGARFRYVLSRHESKDKSKSAQENRDADKTTKAILAEVEKAMANYQAMTQASLLSAANQESNINSQDPAATLTNAVPPCAQFEIDYETLIKALPVDESADLFAFLRWNDPANARHILQAKFKRIRGQDNKSLILQNMLINLSFEDEPMLMHIIQDDSYELPMKYEAKILLRNMGSSQYSALCKDICLLFAHFKPELNCWHIGKYRCYFPKMEAIGIHDDLYARPEDPPTIYELFKCLTWEDLKGLAYAQTDEQALSAYSLSSFTSFIKYDAIMEIIGKAIGRSGDMQAIDAYLNFTGLNNPEIYFDVIEKQKLYMFHGLSVSKAYNLVQLAAKNNAEYQLQMRWASFSSDILMRLDIARRCEVTPHLGHNYPPTAWFLENHDNALDFKLLDERWGQAIINAFMRFTEGYRREDACTYFALFINPSIKDTLRHRIKEIEAGLPEFKKLAQYLYHGPDTYGVQFDLDAYVYARFECDESIRDKLLAELKPTIDKIFSFPFPEEDLESSSKIDKTVGFWARHQVHMYPFKVLMLKEIINNIEKREHIDQVINQALRPTKESTKD